MSALLLVFVVAVFCALLAANVIASRRVLACEISSKSQKLAQFGVIWLLPVAGAVVVLIMTRKQSEPAPGRYPEPREEIEEVAVSKPDYEDAD